MDDNPPPDTTPTPPAEAIPSIGAVLEAMGRVLRAARKRRQLSYVQVSDLLKQGTREGVGPASVRAYESGQRRISIERPLQLAVTYEVPATVLLREAIKAAGQPVECPTCGRR